MVEAVDPRLRGDDDVLLQVVTLAPSFRRMQESIAVTGQWIPACAGVTMFYCGS